MLNWLFGGIVNKKNSEVLSIGRIKRHHTRAVLYIFISTILLGLFQNCSKSHLSTIESSDQASAADVAPTPSEPIPSDSPPNSPPTSSPSPTQPPTGDPQNYPAPVNAYRYQQPRLFNTIPDRYIPSRLAGGTPRDREGSGPTKGYVDNGTGWAWKNAGGDWIDANNIKQGPSPSFSFLTMAASGSTATHTYTADVTAAVQQASQLNLWLAFRLQSSNAGRSIAGIKNSAHPIPKIVVTYADGSTETLPVYLVAAIGSSLTPDTMSQECSLPCFIEFKKPSKVVKTAAITITVTQHWSGAATSINGFLLNPPINTDPFTTGLSDNYGNLDQGITADPNVIGAHRYLNGTKYTDFVSTTLTQLQYNVGAERNYDPAIFGTGAQDLNKFPHLDLGKWIGADPNWSLVQSTFVGDNFKPLVQGLGAMRVTMPKVAGLTDGSEVGYAGTRGSNGIIFLPAADFGYLKRIFVRYYFRIAGYSPTVNERYQVTQSGPNGNIVWTDMAGKIGIAPSHATTFGGVSGTSGGGEGWQMRLSWSDYDTKLGAPGEGSIRLGLHTFDFLTNNPLGHRYGGSDTPKDSFFNQRGGLGGNLYFNQWYCIEMEVDLNTVTGSAAQTNGGWLPDGAVRMWIDGRLTYERQNMVMRSMPLVPHSYNEGTIRGARELGHKELWFNWFHGGLTQNSIDRTVFFTGLVWSRARIGPMKIPVQQ